jgi:hypothetical protein
VGTVGIYNGDTEIDFFEAEMVQVIGEKTGQPAPKPITTAQAQVEAYEGWLAVVTGTVTAKPGTATLFMDDGSGEVRAFLDGYCQGSETTVAAPINSIPTFFLYWQI